MEQKAEATAKSPIANLAKAFTAAWGELQNVQNDAQNPHFGSNYATLAQVLNTIKPVFKKHGLAILQSPAEITDGNVTLVGVLMHESGETVGPFRAQAPLGQKATAQAVGSVLTYLRRYMDAAIAGIAQTDDDGNAASSSPAPEAEKRGAKKSKEKATPASDANSTTYAATVENLIARIQASEDMTALEGVKSEVAELGDQKVVDEYMAKKKALKAKKETK